MRHLRRHPNALAQRGVWVDGFADVHRVCTHFDGQRDLANHVTRVGADHATAEDLAVAPASMGRPTISPMAKMCGTLVHIWMSTLMKPRSVTDTH